MLMKFCKDHIILGPNVYHKFKYCLSLVAIHWVGGNDALGLPIGHEFWVTFSSRKEFVEDLFLKGCNAWAVQAHGVLPTVHACAWAGMPHGALPFENKWNKMPKVTSEWF